jgi:threonine aldolase
MVMVNYLLRSFEGVLCADSAHVAVHESGAIEFTGNKVLTLPSTQGKITAEQVDNYVTTYYSDPNWPHIVPPGMVYITHPTEYGTLYTLSEMEAISAVCRKHHLPLYLDGARLGYGLGASGVSVNGQWAILNAEGIASGSSAVGGAGADFKEPRERSGNYQLSTINSQLPTLPDIARLCDAFYIGGTKCGTMFGEAAIIPRPAADSRFFTHIKRHGALIAKGWTTALQFDTLLEGDTLTATPYYGYHFVQWQDGNTSNPRSIEVTADATYTATFEADTPATGIDDIAGGVMPTLSPNPATSTVVLSLGDVAPVNGQVAILSLHGSVLATYRIEEPDLRIDVSALAAGTYFLRVSTADAAPVVLKLIKL